MKSAISNVHLHPEALSKCYSSSALTFYPFLQGFASNSFVLYKYIWRFLTSSIAKTAELNHVKNSFSSHSLSFLPSSLCTSHLLSLYNLENPPVNGGAIAHVQQAAANETNRITGYMCSGEMRAFHTDEFNSATSVMFWSFSLPSLLSTLSSLSARWILQGYGLLADPMPSASHPVISLKRSVCICHFWSWSTAETWSNSTIANPFIRSLCRRPLLDIDCPPSKYWGSNCSWTKADRGWGVVINKHWLMGQNHSWFL